jgi:hypothetical protein
MNNCKSVNSPNGSHTYSRAMNQPYPRKCVYCGEPEEKIMKKTVEIIGGGTVSHVRSHLAVSAVAYGFTARKIKELCEKHSDKLEVRLYLTRMANSGNGNLETPENIKELADKLKLDPNVKIIFFNPAIVDYDGNIADTSDVYRFGKTTSGKYEERLKSRLGDQMMILTPKEKMIKDIRNGRKDIFLVGFKTTCSENEQYIAGLNLLKESSCNLVLANDTKTRINMIITPEEARYHVTTDRDFALEMLVEMAYLRSHLSFTRSTVVSGESIPWKSELVPESLRKAVDYCIEKGAYKEFRGSTVGHFACKIDDKTFLTSKRKTNFNDLDKNGLVKVVIDGNDTVIAYGSKPSVGGQSQRIIFSEHNDYDCIVHFHCPKKLDSPVPSVSQREYECGSHECGKNTSNGLKRFGNLSAVMLDNHGPNIVFNHTIDPQEVIDFIEANFDLTGKTGGPVKIEQSLSHA